MRRVKLVSRLMIAVAVVMVLGVSVGPVWAVVAPGDTTRVSVSSSGTQATGPSSTGAISADGRYVAFESDASNLVPGDTNGTRDIFVHDRVTGATIRVSVSSSGAQGDYDSYGPSISSDGRYVTFTSEATNLVEGDTNEANDIFVHDRVAGATARVSVDSSGAQGIGEYGSFWPSISSDGRYVAFDSYASNLVAGDTNEKNDVFVHDRTSGATTRVSVSSSGVQGDDWSEAPSISSDGRYVAFASIASNLVPGDTNGRPDAFVHDRVTGATTRVSVSSSGAQAVGGDYAYFVAISSDGRYVAFACDATNLVQGDTNAAYDVFVHDRVTGATTRVSVSSSGAQASGSWCFYPSISSDGRYVAFYSDATNLVEGDTNAAYDVFVHDRVTGAATRVSADSSVAQGDSGSSNPSISSDGRYVAFYSDATNLVPGDTNGIYDVFVRDRSVPGPDVTAPSTTSDRVPYYANTATILLTASDNDGGSGVAHTYYRLNGAAQVEGTTITKSTAGSYSLAYWSVDAAGNVEVPHTVKFTVIAKPSSGGTPSTPASISTLRHGKSFTVYGYIIRHTSGTSPVTLQFYRYQSGHWVLKKSTTAKASTILTFSKYSDSTSVPYSGKWRVRARHKVGTKYLYSGYRTFTAS